VGIATGLVVVGDLIGEGAAQEQAVVGDTPNLAARIQSIAAPGQVAIGDGTRRMIAGMFDVESIGEHELKGIAGRTQAFAVLGERALESRFAARTGDGMAVLVGRDQELALLTQRWRQSANGEGQLVLLTGEAGIGKSRITEALVDAVAGEPHHRVRYQCSPYHTDSALYCAIQHLNFATGIAAQDTPAQRLDKLEAYLHRAPSEDVALIAALMGIDASTRHAAPTLSPQQQRFRTLKAIADYFVALSKDKAVLFVLEDAHWMDPTTRDLIDQSLAAFATARVCLLITTRPGFTHSFAGHPMLTQLTLNRLSRDDVAGIATRAAGGKKLPAALIDEITARSDGVPLYVEEMAKAAIDSGLLKETPEGFALDARHAGLAIPASLQDSLMSRLDRLQPVKDIAQTASVIGRAFDFRTLAAISPLNEDELTRALDKLTDAELIFRQGIPPDAHYLFKHALVRDAAYESLLKAKRQTLHARLLAALETQATAPELLAFHAQAATLPAKAIGYWRTAGDAAMARPAYEEAINHYANAVALAATLPDAREQELELRAKLGLASISAKGHSHADTCAIFDEALRMSGAVDRKDLTFISWYGLWCGHHVRGEIAAATESSRELLAAASAVGEPSHRMMGTRATAITAVMVGDFATALSRHEEAAQFQNPDRDRAFAKIVGQDQTVSFRSYYAINLWAVGRSDEAWRLADESIRLGKAAGHVNSLGYGYMHAAIVALCAGRPEFRTLTDEMIAFCTEHRLEMWREFALQFDAIDRLGKDDASALTDLKAARRALATRHAYVFSSLLAVESARRLIAMARLDEAQSLIEEAHQLIATSGECFAEAEAHRVRGLWHAAKGLSPQSDFDAARATARQQGAKAWEQRANAAQ
ncbi:MAG: AAA family ATPase, partial [Micropepsaceae bacterium]